MTKYLNPSGVRRWLALGSASLLLGGAACNPFQLDAIPDPNNTPLESVLNKPTALQLQALATGQEAAFRLGHTNNAPYYQMTGALCREIVILASNEPRWYNEILGTTGGLNNNSFYSVGSYNAFARGNRAASILRQSVLTAQPVVADSKQIQATLGFADTYEALSKLHLINLMGENGIRIDVADITKPGKFTNGSAPALANIRQLLDKAATELANGGKTFPFALSSGYGGFDTPPTFLLFNRALAARVALYQKDYAGASQALRASFFQNAASTTASDLAVGPGLTFNPAIAGDQSNAYFQQVGSTPSTLVVVPDNFVTEAEPGDLRLGKVASTPAIRSTVRITGNYVPTIYTSPTQPLSIIRNEELVLISAEANAMTGNTAGAVSDINLIRTVAGGLPAYAGATDQASLINEILRQRRYSLFYEGQFLIDLRRLGKLQARPTPQITIPYTAAPFRIFDRLPVPQAEVNWDIANP